MSISLTKAGGGTGRSTTIYEDIITADGSEQTIYISNTQHDLEGHIDVGLLQFGDSITIKQYISLENPVNYILSSTKTITDSQTIQVLTVKPKPSKYGIKMTLQQTAGTYRDFPYIFFSESR